MGSSSTHFCFCLDWWIESYFELLYVQHALLESHGIPDIINKQIPGIPGIDDRDPRLQLPAGIPGIKPRIDDWDPRLQLPGIPGIRLPISQPIAGIPGIGFRVRCFDILPFYVRSTSIAITTTKIQNTILKLAEPFHLQIQFWKLIQFFSWLFSTNLLLVQSIWQRNEAYILFCCCVAWSIIDTLLTPIPYDTIHCHFFWISFNIDTKWVS